jgi:hypothetical protein
MGAEPTSRASGAPGAVYAERHASCLAEERRLAAVSLRLSIARGVTFAGFLACLLLVLLAASRPLRLPLAGAGAALAVFAVLALVHDRCLRPLRRAEELRRIAGEGLARLDPTGEPAAPPSRRAHYRAAAARDLDLYGRTSLPPAEPAHTPAAKALLRDWLGSGAPLGGGARRRWRAAELLDFRQGLGHSGARPWAPPARQAQPAAGRSAHGSWHGAALGRPAPRHATVAIPSPLAREDGRAAAGVVVSTWAELRLPGRAGALLGRAAPATDDALRQALRRPRSLRRPRAAAAGWRRKARRRPCRAGSLGAGWGWPTRHSAPLHFRCRSDAAGLPVLAPARGLARSAGRSRPALASASGRLEALARWRRALRNRLVPAGGGWASGAGRARSRASAAARGAARRQ